MWPPGSDNQALPGKTRALPEIWSTFPAVMEKANALTSALEAMVVAAGPISPAFRARSARSAQAAAAVTAPSAPKNSNGGFFSFPSGAGRSLRSIVRSTRVDA